MWKKQWNKLKTALGEPEEYIEAEPENEEVPEEVSFRSEPVINVKFEDFVDIAEMMKLSENIKKSAGELALRHARERQTALQWDDEINAKIQEQIMDLRTTYSVDPSVDYRLDFPQTEGSAGAFVRISTPEEGMEE